jgi:hypothetical protein
VKKLTIGMAVHDDFDGIYFTLQSIRMFHKEILDEVEFIIIDNNPTSKHGKSLREYIEWIQEPVQYLPFTKYNSTIVRNKVFELADTPYVLCMDSHVFVESGAIKKLIEFFDAGKDRGNLLQGPLVYDDMKNISTHFNLEWRSHMWGTWGTDDRGIDPNNEPFEIPSQGLGLFACRKDSWLGFNKNFRGFGGEEGYIHAKYKKHGKTTLCLPFLRWMHRFQRPNGVSYPNNLKARFRNYMIGFKELGLPLDELKDHFKEVVDDDYILSIEEEIKSNIT